MSEKPVNLLYVLANIAKAYIENNLEDHRRFWGPNSEHEHQANFKDMLLVDTRGGGTLLTLEHCMQALEEYNHIQLAMGKPILIAPIVEVSKR